MEHKIAWREVFDGRAEVRISPESLLRLAKLAGAPWNEMDPDAELSDLQKEIVTAPERTVVVFGGSRGGKSVSAAVMGLGALMIPNAKIALIGGTFEHCSKEFGYIWRGFFNLFPKSAAVDRQFIARKPHFAMRIVTVWGAELNVFSTGAKEGAQILGNEFDMAILCEAAQVPHEIFNNKVERALLGRAKKRGGTGYLRRTGRAILLTTPKGMGGSSYDLYNRALARTKGNIDRLLLRNLEKTLSPEDAWFDSLYFCQADVRALNPTYPVEAFEHARRTLPKHDFAEQFLGRAVLKSGLAYSSFKEDRHVLEKDKLPSLEELRRCTIGVGIDTGTNFAAILAALTPEGKAYVIGEVFEVGQNSRQNAESIMDMLGKTLGEIAPNPKELVTLWVVDINSQNIGDLEEALEVTFDYQKHDVADSIGTLDVRMGAGEVFIADDCEFLLNELRNLRWKRYEASQATIKKDKTVGTDHCCDAFRYLLMQLFEHGPPKTDAPAFTVDQILEKERNEMLRAVPVADMMAKRGRDNFLEGIW